MLICVIAATAAIATIGREHDALFAARAAPRGAHELAHAADAGFSGAARRSASAAVVRMAIDIDTLPLAGRAFTELMRAAGRTHAVAAILTARANLVARAAVIHIAREGHAAAAATGFALRAELVTGALVADITDPAARRAGAAMRRVGRGIDAPPATQALAHRARRVRAQDGARVARRLRLQDGIALDLALAAEQPEERR